VDAIKAWRLDTSLLLDRRTARRPESRVPICLERNVQWNMLW